MDPKVIYRKTAKGQEEMATRAYRLPVRERSVLVLVDGRRHGQELVEKGRHFGDGAAILDGLIAGGFVEAAIDEPVAAPPSPPELDFEAEFAASARPAGTGKRSSNATVSAAALSETVNFARHFLLGSLGPDGDELASRIESSRNLRDLTPLLIKGRDALAALCGRRKADEFWQGVLARLPQISSAGG